MNAKGYFRFLRMLFYAMLSGQLIFAIVSLILIYSGSWQATIQSSTLFYAIILIAYLIAYYAFGFISKKLLSDIKSSSSISKKLNKYTSFVIIRYGLLEGVSFMASVFFLLTADLVFLAFALLVIFVFSRLYPDKNRVINESSLSLTEQKQLDNPDFMIDNFMMSK